MRFGIGITKLVIISVLFVVVGCGKSVDEKMTTIRTGMSIVDVIEILGKPHGAWGSPVNDKMTFIYKGKKTYSILFRGSWVLDTVEGRLGGANAVPLNERIDVVIKGNAIEFRRHHQ